MGKKGRFTVGTNRVRMIDGKRYQSDIAYSHKKDAKEFAKSKRTRKGVHSVRIVKDKTQYGDMVYYVYYR